MYVFGMCILVFFAIVGLCAFITGLLEAAYKGDDKASLLLRDLSADDAEARIRSAAQICRNHKSIKLRCVCKQGDPAYDICILMQKEYPFLEVEDGMDSR